MFKLNKLKSQISRIPVLGPALHNAYYLVLHPISALHRRLSELENRVTTLEQSVNERQAALKVNFARALARKQDILDYSASQNDNETAQLQEDDLALFYDNFEATFRADPVTLRQHLENYSPFLNGLCHRSQKPSLDALDIGCGRGEWLGLMKEWGHQATGIDMNSISVEQCRLKGYDVVHGDAIQYLNSLEANSFDLITAFHVVEHLSFETLLKLFDSASKALKPGGLIIFETPNPENLTVSGYSFYLDPSHQHPIPPLTLRFIAEQRGFRNCDIQRYNPREEVSESLPLTKQWFANSVDYALIGEK